MVNNIDTDKYEGHTPAISWRKADGSAMSMQTANNDADAELMADAPLLLAAYDKQVRWINDILFRLEKMQEASEEYRSRYLQKVYEELEMMIE